MTVKSAFAAFLGLFAAIGLGHKPVKQVYGRAKKHTGIYDPYPNHRHKSKAEKARIARWHEEKRTGRVVVGGGKSPLTNHQRVVFGRAQRQGLTVEEYKLKYG